MGDLLISKKCTEKKLIKNGFKKYGGAYKKYIPLYKYQEIVLIEMSIRISLEHQKFEYVVTDNNTNGLYIPFYSDERYGRNEILERVRENVSTQLKLLKKENIIYEAKDRKTKKEKERGKENMRKVATFEKVSFEQFKKDMEDYYFSEEKLQVIYDSIKLPKRSTVNSAGHDISIPFKQYIPKGTSVMVSTGLRCKMDSDHVMLIFPRSSLGIKKGLFLSNTIPVVDSDYYYADNEGHIFLSLKNTSNADLMLEAGEKIVQAVFVKFGTADEEKVTTKRTGGIGSTNEK